MGINENRPGLLEGKNVLVMGLADLDSYAWAIGEKVLEEGGNLTYTIQRRAILKQFAKSVKEKGLDIRIQDRRAIECNVTDDESVQKMADQIERPLHGLVYSVAYANPRTCLGENMFDAPSSDVLQALDVSVVGFGRVINALQDKFVSGSSIIAMTFDSQHTHHNYGWMGPCKDALEGTTRALAAEKGHLGWRANNISAGPQRTMSASSIPGFEDIAEIWSRLAPLAWDLTDPSPVADTAAYLLSDMSRMVTGGTHYVDGGAQIVRIPHPKS